MLLQLPAEILEMQVQNLAPDAHFLFPYPSPLSMLFPYKDYVQNIARQH